MFQLCLSIFQGKKTPEPVKKLLDSEKTKHEEAGVIADTITEESLIDESVNLDPSLSQTSDTLGLENCSDVRNVTEISEPDVAEESKELEDADKTLEIDIVPSMDLEDSLGRKGLLGNKSVENSYENSENANLSDIIVTVEDVDNNGGAYSGRVTNKAKGESASPGSEKELEIAVVRKFEVRTEKPESSESNSKIIAELEEDAMKPGVEDDSLVLSDLHSRMKLTETESEKDEACQIGRYSDRSPQTNQSSGMIIDMTSRQKENKGVKDLESATHDQVIFDDVFDDEDARTITDERDLNLKVRRFLLCSVLSEFAVMCTLFFFIF